MEKDVVKLVELGIFIDDNKQNFACEISISEILFQKAEEKEMEKLKKLIDDVSIQILKITNDALENKNKGDN